MKRKNLVLAAIAFVFAIGGAIASSFVAANVYVKARLQEDGAITCQNTGVQCDGSGTAVCSVQVTTASGPVIASSTGTFKTYLPPTQTTSCVDINRSIQAQSFTSSLSVYELVP